LQVLKDIEHPATSREISHALSIADPEVGRQLVRTRMARLAEEGRVVVKEALKGTRACKVFSLT